MFCKGGAPAWWGAACALTLALSSFPLALFFFFLTIALDGVGLGLHFAPGIGASGLHILLAFISTRILSIRLII